MRSDARPTDAAATDATAADATPTDAVAAPADATLADAAPLCVAPSPSCMQDQYECNDTAATAAQLTLSGGGSGYASTSVSAFLCSGNEDWYFVPTSVLGVEAPTIKVRGLARDAGLCGASCDEVELPPAEENTLTIELYDVAGATLLASGTAADGVVRINRTDEQYGADVLMRITGPAAAEYEYRITISVQDFTGEDECEC